MIAVENIRVLRRGAEILRDISLELIPGEVLAIVGPNGAGKSTLLQVMSGDLLPQAGTVKLEGRALKDWAPLALARRRSVMPQAARLGFPLPARDVVALGRLPFERLYDRSANQAAVAAAIGAADIAHLAARSYATLSGGEQQRVQLARAMAQLDLEASVPPLLLLDEPTASLDLAHAHGVLRLARRLAGQGVAVAAVLHDLGLAHAYADRVAVLQQGRLLALDVPARALTPEILAQAFAVDAAFYDGHLVIRGPLAA
ncbi:heme ABC transporter ATP-binding protein [Ferrovibrio sp.]|uniref:heme ABC transporter ATP-binding protein n=1 Tax=Ferrovibrio sp. TaxID=1917215 RepID=UPI003D105B53